MFCESVVQSEMKKEIKMNQILLYESPSISSSREQVSFSDFMSSVRLSVRPTVCKPCTRNANIYLKACT